MIKQLFIDKALFEIMLHDLNDYEYLEFDRNTFNFKEIIESDFILDKAYTIQKSSELSKNFNSIKSDKILFILSSKKDALITQLEREILNEKFEKQAKAKHAQQLQTPLFAKSKEQAKKISTVYKLSKRLNEKLNVVHNVDHVIPLRHKLISGLHCAENLHVITAHDNMSSCNNFDMYAVLNIHDPSLFLEITDLDSLNAELDEHIKEINIKRRMDGLKELNMLETIEAKGEYLRTH